MTAITLEHLEKRFPNGAVAVRDLSLTVAEGELLVLVGPSGSGKSTVVRMIAGLESVTAGHIRFDGEDVSALPPQARNVAMVFQNYALYPHMTVRDNLAFGLRMRGHRPPDIADRVQRVADSLDLASLLERKPSQLSGGQRQRVALGRAIVRDPRAFLFDEPLSNLDARLRTQTRAELARLHRRLAATMVYVTHDQVEAMTLGDRVAVLRDGELQQVAPPMELYHEPANLFVAGFIGSPAMNVLRGRVETAAGRPVFTGQGLTIPLDRPVAAIPEAGVVLGIRPEDVQLAEGPESTNLPVTLVEPLGNAQIVHLALPDNGELVVSTSGQSPVRQDQALAVRIPPRAVHLFHAVTGRRVA